MFKVCENCCLHIAEESVEMTTCPRCGEECFEHHVQTDGSMRMDSISFSDDESKDRPMYYMGMMVEWNDEDEDVELLSNEYCDCDGCDDDEDPFEHFIIEMEPEDMLVMINHCIHALAINERVDRKSAVDYLTNSMNMLCERAKFDAQRRTEAN
jgi:hypothetical protein